jgi:hypothetical protein
LGQLGRCEGLSVAQIALELAYSFFVELLCYGTGYFILRALGFRNTDRHEYVVGVVGFLFWFTVGILIWRFFGV